MAGLLPSEGKLRGSPASILGDAFAQRPSPKKSLHHRSPARRFYAAHLHRDGSATQHHPSRALLTGSAHHVAKSLEFMRVCTKPRVAAPRRDARDAAIGQRATAREKISHTTLARRWGVARRNDRRDEDSRHR
jgi:hypothetical protein